MGKLVTSARWLFCIEEVLVFVWVLIRLDVSHPSSLAGDYIEEVLVLVWVLIRLDVSHPSSTAGDCIKEVLVLVWLLLRLDVSHHTLDTHPQQQMTAV